MNPTQLTIEAGIVLADWQRHHNSACQLYIYGGHVKGRIPDDISYRLYPDLVFSPWHLEHGLTSAQWDNVGTALHNLYTKEIACQAHQKP